MTKKPKKKIEHSYYLRGNKKGICRVCGCSEEAVDHFISGLYSPKIKAHWRKCIAPGTDFEIANAKYEDGVLVIDVIEKEKSKIMKLDIEYEKASHTRKLRVSKSSGADVQIEIEFEDGKFKRCDYYGMDNVYDREDWQILGMIEKEIRKLERKFKK